MLNLNEEIFALAWKLLRKAIKYSYKA